MMRNLSLMLALISVAPPLFSICNKCVEIRENNEKLVQKYQFYEDYLSAIERGEDPPKVQESK